MDQISHMGHYYGPMQMYPGPPPSQYKGMPYYMHPMPYHPGMMHGFYPGQQCGYPGVMPQNLPSSIPKEASKKKIYVQ